MCIYIFCSTIDIDTHFSLHCLVHFIMVKCWCRQCNTYAGFILSMLEEISRWTCDEKLLIFVHHKQLLCGKGFLRITGSNLIGWFYAISGSQIALIFIRLVRNQSCCVYKVMDSDNENFGKSSLFQSKFMVYDILHFSKIFRDLFVYYLISESESFYCQIFLLGV